MNKLIYYFHLVEITRNFSQFDPVFESSVFNLFTRTIIAILVIALKQSGMEETQEYPRYFDDNDPMLGGNDGDIDEEFEDRGQAVATLTWKSQVFPLYEGGAIMLF